MQNIEILATLGPSSLNEDTIKKLTDKLIGMIPKTFGKGEVTTTIDWTKLEGMESSGHAYIGKDASRVPNGDTVDEWNDFTEVKLDPNKIVGK